MDRPALIAVDVDGTIAGTDHLISPRTREVLSRLYPAGIAGVVVTGRAEWVTRRIARSIGFRAPAISSNGAVISVPDGGEKLWVRHVDPDDAAHAVSVARAHGAEPSLWTTDAWYADQDGSSIDLLNVLLECPPQRRRLEEVIATEDVVKIMIGGSPELLDEIGPSLEASVPGMVRSMSAFYEAGPADITKREAMAFLLESLEIDPADAWGFGDSDIDTGWLSLLGRAVATSNAFPGVLDIADVVIGHHGDDAVADYLEAELFS